MRCSFRWLVKVAGFAMLLGAALRMPAAGQESREGARAGRSASRPASTRTDSEQSRPRSFLSGGGEANEADVLSDEPTESIELTLWIVTVAGTSQPPADELSSNLAERVGNLPSVVGTVGDVRTLVDQMKVAGLVRKAREFRLVALDGQAISAQKGRNQPRVVGTNVDPRLGRTNIIQYEPLGTLVELRPRIDASRNIKVSAKIGESDLKKSTDVLLAQPVDGSPEFADVVTTRQFNTSATVKNNTAVLLQSLVSADAQDDAGTETELIILGAAIVPTSE